MLHITVICVLVCCLPPIVRRGEQGQDRRHPGVGFGIRVHGQQTLSKVDENNEPMSGRTDPRLSK